MPPRSPPSSPATDSERGSVTVTAAYAVAAVLVIAIGGAQLGSVIVARHTAQAAADLAALAVAATLADGPGPACARGNRLAQAMGAELTECRIEGLDAVVTAQVGVRLRIGPEAARAAARAGPARGTH